MTTTLSNLHIELGLFCTDRFLTKLSGASVLIQKANSNVEISSAIALWLLQHELVKTKYQRVLLPMVSVLRRNGQSHVKGEHYHPIR
jgi:hypothetical protein